MRLELRFEPSHLVAVGEILELAGIDGDRARGDEGPPASVRADAAIEVAVGVEQVAARAQEAAAPAMRVEADDVVREQPVVDRVPDRLGKHAPDVRLRPRDVHEVGERGIGPRLAHEPRREVEVIVVEDDRRVGLRVQLGKGGLGKGAVHRHVAVLPRMVEAWIDVRRVGERPQVVLEEPERGVRDDVVEPVVSGRVVGDEPQPVRRAVAGNFARRPRRRTRRRPPGPRR